MRYSFEWDSAKARSNRAKHGVGFDEATTVLADPRMLSLYMRSALAALALALLPCWGPAGAWAAAGPGAVPRGVVRLEGSPQEIGRQHGTLLARQMRTMVDEYVRDDLQPDRRPGPALLDRVRRMKGSLPGWYLEELTACAQAAAIEEDVLLYAQCEGDIRSVGGCTAYVAFGTATPDGRVEMGRNFDYWGLESTAECAIILAVVPRPEDGHAFVAVGWSGILGGWTLFNEKGLFVANNLGGFFERSPTGIPTLILTRILAQKAASLDEAIALIRGTPRMRGQSLVLGWTGDPERGLGPQAAVIEYDAKTVQVNPAEAGFVSDSSVGTDPEMLQEGLRRRRRDAYDTIRSAGSFITLHSVAIWPQQGQLWVAHGRRSSAHQGPYVRYDLPSLLLRP
jgi:hypothetical protein